MKNLTMFGLVAIIIILLTGCADVVDVQDCLPAGGHTYGFWGGTWHGMIAGFSFIGSLFSDNIAVYAINNNGGWYNFGFVGGAGFMIKLFASIINKITE